MADLTITETLVVAQDDAKVGAGIAGGTLTQGQPIYQDTAGQMQLAADTDATVSNAKGISITAGSAGEQVFWVREGGIALGATLAVGSRYFVSASGKIQPHADVGSGDFVTYLGTATTAAILDVKIHASGVAVP